VDWLMRIQKHFFVRLEKIIGWNGKGRWKKEELAPCVLFRYGGFVCLAIEGEEERER